MIENEKWLPIVKYEGLYEVSDLGRVRRINAWIITTHSKPRRLFKRGKLITQSNRCGYRRVSLTKNGKCKHYSVHRLVLEAFVGECPDGMECCHYNGIRSDNHLENLRWDTQENNVKDNYRLGNTPNCEIHGKTKLTNDNVRSIKLLLCNKWLNHNQIAYAFDVSRQIIDCISSEKTWKKLTWD